MSTNDEPLAELPRDRQGNVIIDEAEAAREARQERFRRIGARVDRLARAQKERSEEVYDYAMALLQQIWPISEAELPDRGAEEQTASAAVARMRRHGRPLPSERHQHLKIKSPAVQEVFNKYPLLGWCRMRCYVQTSKTGSVRQWDVIIPEWDGDLMFDPRKTWDGPGEDYIGSRPASGPKDVHLLEPEKGSYKSKDEIEDFATEHVKVFGRKSHTGKENYYWRQHDLRWLDKHEPSEDSLKFFAEKLEGILDEVETALDNEIAKTEAQTAKVRGAYYLQPRGLESGGDRDADLKGKAAAPPDRPAPAGTNPQQPARRGAPRPDHLDLN